MRRYAKPVVVADDLALLHGPIVGIVTLPRHLDWSGSADYDLDSLGRIVDLYRTVLIEATKPADLHAFLDQAILIRLWPSLWLPPHLRRAWEEHFPNSRGPAPEMELAADWRPHSPMTLNIGPVQHPDDAVGNKMAALYGWTLQSSIACVSGSPIGATS